MGDSEVENQLIVSRLSEKTSTSRIEGLDLLREHLKRNNGVLRCRDKESIFKALSLSLEDTSWKIRHLTIEVLRDMISKFGDELDDLYAPMLPQLIENIGDNKVEIRKDVIQTLHTYMKNSLNVGFLLQLYLEFGLQSDDEKVQKESIINLPVLMSPEFANEDLFEISQSLLAKIPGHDDPRSIWRCIDRLKLVVGEDRFESYVSHMNKDIQTIYNERMNATTGGASPGQNANNSSDAKQQPQTPHVTLTARELAAKLTAASRNELESESDILNMGSNSKRGSKLDYDMLQYGIIKPDVMIKLTNRDEWQLRLHGIEDLKTDVTQLNDVTHLKKDLVEFIGFLCRFLTDEVNFKITMSTLEIFVVLIKKLGALTGQYVEPLTAALSHRLGDSKIVIRQLNSRAFRELMYTATPMPVLEQILPCLKHRNSRVREETVNVIISALLTFPTTDFDFTTLCDTLAPCLADPKRRVRQAALEVFAVLAQLMGVNNLKPLIRAIEMLEPEFGDSPMNAIKARVARRQLPMIKENGMVDYATSLAASSATVSSIGLKNSRTNSSSTQPSSAGSVPQSAGSISSNSSQFGADIEWILKASGSSRGGNLPGDASGNTSMANADSIASDSLPSSATERRAVVLSSAGKKLPWDQPPPAAATINNNNNHQSNFDNNLPNGFKKPLIPPSKNRNTLANRSKPYHSDELDSSNLSSGYISMNNSGRPYSDTSAKFSPYNYTTNQRHYENGDGNEQMSLAAAGGGGADIYNSAMEKSGAFGMEGFPTKPQLARSSATSRETKANVLRSTAARNINFDPPNVTEDMPLDDKALCSVRNSAAKKKAEKRTNTADSMPNPNQSNTNKSGPWGEKTSNEHSRLELENLPVETLEQKVEMYTAVRKSYNPQLYKDTRMTNEEKAKYSSAPLNIDLHNHYNGDNNGHSAVVDDSAVVLGGGDSSVEMSNFTKKKIDDLKEKKRQREKEEKRNANAVANANANNASQKEQNSFSNNNSNNINTDREEAWVEPTAATDARLSLNSAPAAGKPPPNQQPKHKYLVAKSSANYQQQATSQTSSSSANNNNNGEAAAASRGGGGGGGSFSATAPSSNLCSQPQLRSNPDVEFKRAMGLVQHQDWSSKCEGMALLTVLSEKHPEILGAQMHDVNLAVVAEIKNLRSQVSREAIKLMRTLFKNLDKRMDLDLELTVGCLLNKTADSSGFIRDDVEKALTTMAEKATPNKSIAAITLNAQHKSKEVRKTASYILCIILERVLDPSRGIKNKGDVICQAISAIASFALDSAPESRFYGKKMLWILMQESPSHLEAALLKSVVPSNVHPLKKIMDTMRNNDGPGDHPNETPSAKLARKPSYNSRTFSGGSVRLESGGSDNDQMTANATYPPPGSTPPVVPTKSSAGGGGGGGAGGPKKEKRFTDDDKELIRSIIAHLKSNDFRERENGIINLVDLSGERPDLVGSNINAIFDEFIHRLTDSNSKVNLLALQSTLKLVPLLRDYFSIVANMAIPAVAQNMASNRPEMRNLSLDIIDAMIDHIDQTSLLQPLSTLARFGNSRIRPDIIFKLATLVTHLYPRKPQMVIRQVLPVLWQLVGNLSGSGATPGSSSSLRPAAQRLATNLYSFMGQTLLDMADGELTAPRNKLTLKQLVEVS